MTSNKPTRTHKRPKPPRAKKINQNSVLRETEVEEAPLATTRTGRQIRLPELYRNTKI
jgi:hypothetical protein